MSSPPLADIVTNTNKTLMFGIPVPIMGERQEFDVKQEESAACDLRNMSKKEMKRRYVTSVVGLIGTVGWAAFLLDGERDYGRSRVLRTSLIFPVGVFVAYLISAKAGICGVSASGEWDPDSRGLRKAPVELAKKLWVKAKKIHIAQLIVSITLTLAFVALPSPPSSFLKDFSLHKLSLGAVRAVFIQ